MEHTVYDLSQVQSHVQAPAGHAEYPRWFRVAVVVACVAGAMVWMWRFLSPRHEPALVQRSVALPAPEPLSVQIAPPPVVVSPPPALPQMFQLPPPRPSLWEIRAELKRGLGEWEFPHYVNAPHYGSGPGSPAPSLLKPHFASALAE